jgi:hypothetical protein
MLRRSSSSVRSFAVCAVEACCVRARLVNCQTSRINAKLAYIYCCSSRSRPFWIRTAGVISWGRSVPVSANIASSLAISRRRFIVDVPRSKQNSKSLYDIQTVLTTNGFIIGIWCRLVRVPLLNHGKPLLYDIA